MNITSTSKHAGSGLILLTLACLQPVSAQTLAPIVVTGTVERPVFEVPASVSLIDGELMRDQQMQVNLSESLSVVPGLVIQNRQNYAQDLQVSIRGFGSRSTFGMRGIRLYVDGIPATMPDGQGQTSNIDIASIDRVEVLRGPFSALYGNSSGGVIQVFTQDGSGPLQITSSFTAGSDNQRRYALKASGSAQEDRLDYLLSTSRYTTDGYRDHSAARKNLANARLGLQLDDNSQLTLVMNSVDLKADDPQGLTYDEFNNDPRSAAPNALRFDTRKTVKQTQGGLTYQRRINAENELRLMAYYGQRKTTQYLAIPVATQMNPGHAGGVIDLTRDYAGADLRWTSRLTVAGRPLTLIGGIAYDTLTEDRLGYENFSDGRLGVQGDLRRKEVNELWNIDPYLQASWQFAPRWTLDAGLRYSTVHFNSDDRYITHGNGDGSGSARYEELLPMAALRYQPVETFSVYATVGRGFETPTFNEISYRPNDLPGLNFGLRPSVNTSIEVGAKAKLGGGMLTAALFQTRTEDEIVSAGGVGGRTTYRNAGRTRRNGFELGWSSNIARHWRAEFAYTWLDARYRDSFYSGEPNPANLVPAGNRIPGISEHSFFASLAWAPSTGWRAGIEGRYLSKFYVNDSNDEAAPAYFTASLHAGYLWQFSDWDVNAFARVDNVLDKHYAGSVIVNAGFGRYYEPAPGRNWTAGLGATYRF
ncbi:TonB-dependent receptor [Pusillimonas sp. MFBS29]|uniref:TonB-dependent receptor family protein n=1 Tax=Pusillimonas sp. MFBS29 TaxID=2886690 RepID=UPI001D12C296|nr:TonB-dependent receptor [Pusillimonas sp. MFBS29]MCC2595824.1 TonB-dependent receptor [Pusillimonas sp. MFBS29]